jgi:hypothetical protein
MLTRADLDTPKGRAAAAKVACEVLAASSSPFLPWSLLAVAEACQLDPSRLMVYAAELIAAREFGP